MLSAAAKATTPKDVLSPEAAAKAAAETAAKKAEDALRKQAERGDYFQRLYSMLLKCFLQPRKQRRQPKIP